MDVMGFLSTVLCLRRQRGGDATPATGFPTLALLLRYPVCADLILLHLSVEFRRNWVRLNFCTASQCWLRRQFVCQCTRVAVSPFYLAVTDGCGTTQARAPDFAFPKRWPREGTDAPSARLRPRLVVDNSCPHWKAPAATRGHFCVSLAIGLHVKSWSCIRRFARL